jgi:hypothetical protein
MAEQKGQKIRAILTGATGMVGEGVLHECLEHPDVEAVLVIGRKDCGVQHPKMRQLLHSDFLDIRPLEPQLRGYNACFFCLGVSSIGMKEPEYSRMTHELTLHVAKILSSTNPDMTFCYVSGSGTDSSENGRFMWARVKGRTENDLFRLPFRQVFAFRPGYMHPTRGLKNTLKGYRYITWLYPLMRGLFPHRIITLAELGLAMIYVGGHDYGKQILESRDIIALAHKETESSRLAG